MKVISVKQLSRHYGQRRGIESVDLSINAGEIFGFLGPNGAGKTTTIRVLLGFLRPTHGEAKIFGLDCWSQSATIKKEVGYLPGDLRLYPWFSGKNALQIVGAIRGFDQTRQRGRELFARFQLDENVPVSKMSRGMRQKLGIVLALTHNPKLVILDEPTSALDPLMCDELYRCLRELAAKGATVVFSSHTLSEVELLCERVAIVRDGKIVADEAMDSLRGRSHRSVKLRFSNDAATTLAPPDFLKIEHRTDRTWRCELKGTASQLVAWAAGKLLEDLEVGPQSLESLFLSYYQLEEESA